MSETKRSVQADQGELSYTGADGLPLWGERGERITPGRDGRQTVVFLPPDSAYADGNAADGFLSRYSPPTPKEGADREYLKAHVLTPVTTVHTLERGGASPVKLGIVCPDLPERYRFGVQSSGERAMSAVRAGKARVSTCYLSDNAAGSLLPEERGDLVHLLSAMAALARTVDLLHRQGYALHGFSDRNVLLDPVKGDAALLVGLETRSGRLVPCVPPRPLPSRCAPPEAFTDTAADDDAQGGGDRPAADLEAGRQADRWSLAVLFYQLLCHRHPLEGPWQWNADGSRKPDREIYGPEARFVEDDSAAGGLDRTLKDLGEGLEAQFRHVFTDGLTRPAERPTAAQWQVLLETHRQRVLASTPPASASGAADAGTPAANAHGSNAPAVHVHGSPNPTPGAGTGSPGPGPAQEGRKVPAQHPNQIRISVGWEGWLVSPPSNAPKQIIDLDISAFLLNSAGKANSSGDMVFYNNQIHSSHSVFIPNPLPADRSKEEKMVLVANLDEIPSPYAQIDFAVTASASSDGGRYTEELAFGKVSSAFMKIRSSAKETVIQLDKQFRDSSVCVLSIRRENGRWQPPKIKGCNGGLEALCRQYHINVKSQ